MSFFRILTLGALLLTTPALAQDWRVESVIGDAVATRMGAEPESLEVGSIVPVGSTVVSGSQSTVTLRHDNDVVSFGANAVAELRSPLGDARAVVAPAVGDFQFQTVADDTGPFEVVTKWFRADSDSARFSVRARKDGAWLEVASGVVNVRETQRVADPVEVKQGGSFHGEPAPKIPEAKLDGTAKADLAGLNLDDKTKAVGAKGGDVDIAQLNELSKKLPKGGKLSKNQRAMVKSLTAQGVQAVKEGLDAMADDADGDPLPVAPRIGLLDFLFGKDAPNLGEVLGGIGVVFVIFGAVTARLLAGVSFGTLGNGVILLAGAFGGAWVHDYACPPQVMWDYEPTPCIVLVTFGALVALLGACFVRSLVEDQIDAAHTAAARERATMMMRQRFS